MEHQVRFYTMESLAKLPPHDDFNSHRLFSYCSSRHMGSKIVNLERYFGILSETTTSYLEKKRRNKSEPRISDKALAMGFFGGCFFMALLGEFGWEGMIYFLVKGATFLPRNMLTIDGRTVL